ncbi:hypothetical protein KJQ78_03760 [Campylobacter lari]|uniref:hypothetical protein n=1 Tax=Campylobacter lari TaxID=201 RepID=UPI00126F5BF9|nr:hypothetical protein [Campylobacter lari]MBT0824376.1 hypothetical protein [Campylobacter lari]
MARKNENQNKPNTSNLDENTQDETLKLQDDVKAVDENIELTGQSIEEKTTLIKEQGEQMPPKNIQKSLSNEPLVAMPKGLESLIAKDLFSINAKVDMELNPSLARGTLLISEDYGENFKKCSNEDISAKENIKLAVLKDDVFNNGYYGVLLMGEVILSDIHQSAIKKAFLQNLIINTKE